MKEAFKNIEIGQVRNLGGKISETLNYQGYTTMS
jgi:hypothetical protein